MQLSEAPEARNGPACAEDDEPRGIAGVGHEVQETRLQKEAGP